MARERRQLAETFILCDDKGTKYTVHKYLIQIAVNDLQGTDWMDNGYAFQTSTGLHVNFDGVKYSLPQRNETVLQRTQDAIA